MDLIHAFSRRHRWNWRSLPALLLCVNLSGCPFEEDNNNHGYGYDYDFITPLGIKYRNDSDGEPLTADQIDTTIRNAAACLGYAVRSRYDLFVITVEQLNDYPEEWEGIFATDPELIAVEDLRFTGIELDMLEHEIVHFILWIEEGDIDDDHKSPCYPHGTTL